MIDFKNAKPFIDRVLYKYDVLYFVYVSILMHLKNFVLVQIHMHLPIGEDKNIADEPSTHFRLREEQCKLRHPYYRILYL